MPEKNEVKPAAPVIDPSVAALIKDIVVEARRPVKTEKELREEAAAEDLRVNMRVIEKNRQTNKANEQNACQHVHGDGVGTHVVYVANLNRLYCQKCQAWIYSTIHEAAQNGSLIAPEKHPELWNRHWDRAVTGGM
jgi:hypothetical protein